MARKKNARRDWKALDRPPTPPRPKTIPASVAQPGDRSSRRFGSEDSVTEQSTDRLRDALRDWEGRLLQLRRANPYWRLGGVGDETEADHALALAEATVAQLKTTLALRGELASTPRSGEKRDEEPSEPEAFAHSPDYRSVSMKGKTFPLTAQQAHVIRMLHDAHKGGNPELSTHHILEELGTPGSRLRDTFRSSPEAWKALVADGTTRGAKRLNL